MKEIGLPRGDIIKLRNRKNWFIFYSIVNSYWFKKFIKFYIENYKFYLFITYYKLSNY